VCFVLKVINTIKPFSLTSVLKSSFLKLTVYNLTQRDSNLTACYRRCVALGETEKMAATLYISLHIHRPKPITAIAVKSYTIQKQKPTVEILQLSLQKFIHLKNYYAKSTAWNAVLKEECSAVDLPQFQIQTRRHTLTISAVLTRGSTYDKKYQVVIELAICQKYVTVGQNGSETDSSNRWYEGS
jgi:hypothetical protein